MAAGAGGRGFNQQPPHTPRPRRLCRRPPPPPPRPIVAPPAAPPVPVAPRAARAMRSSVSQGSLCGPLCVSLCASQRDTGGHTWVLPWGNASEIKNSGEITAAPLGHSQRKENLNTTELGRRRQFKVVSYDYVDIAN